jgi:hypothetical protein
MNKEHHQGTKAPRKAKADSNAVLGDPLGIACGDTRDKGVTGALVVKNQFLLS